MQFVFSFAPGGIASGRSVFSIMLVNDLFSKLMRNATHKEAVSR